MVSKNRLRMSLRVGTELFCLLPSHQPAAEVHHARFTKSAIVGWGEKATGQRSSGREWRRAPSVAFRLTTNTPLGAAPASLLGRRSHTDW